MDGMRKLFQEFLGSLKKLELEEPADLWLFRPPAFLLVKVLAPSPITPNMVSVGSLLCGLAAAGLFWTGNPENYVEAGLFYYLAHLLDCADGQLARLRHQKSYVGYLMDGMMDYLGTIAVFAGIAHGLSVQTGHPAASWALTAAGGLSLAWSCYVLDRKRWEWMHRVYGKFAGDDGELKKMEKDANIWKKEGSHLVIRTVIFLHIGYTRFFGSLTKPLAKAPSGARQAEAYRRQNLPTLRRALLSGPGAHCILVCVFGAMNHLPIYLWGVLSLGNAWVIILLILQTRDRQRAAARA